VCVFAVPVIVFGKLPEQQQQMWQEQEQQESHMATGQMH